MKILIKSNSRRLDRLQSIVEWIVVAFLFVGGISLLYADPATPITAIGKILGSVLAGKIYSAVLLTEAILMAYAKVTKNKKLHGRLLMIICLSVVYTIWIEALVIGFGWYSIDNIVVALLAGGAWLRWRLRTAYLDPNEFNKEISGLSGDFPPSRRM